MNTDPNESKSEELNESELDSVTGGQGKYDDAGNENYDNPEGDEENPADSDHGVDPEKDNYNSDGTRR